MREAYGEGCAQPLDWKRQPELQSHGPSRSICVLNPILRANPRSRSHCRGSLWLPLLPSHCNIITADRTVTRSSLCFFNTQHIVTGQPLGAPDVRADAPPMRRRHVQPKPSSCSVQRPLLTP